MKGTTAYYIQCPFFNREDKYNCNLPCCPCYECKAPLHFIKADGTCQGCINCMNAHKPHMSESDADSGAACNG